jgi:hypothetical protein
VEPPLLSPPFRLTGAKNFAAREGHSPPGGRGSKTSKRPVTVCLAMLPRNAKIVPMIDAQIFATAIECWDQYCAMYHQSEGYHQDLAAEVKERLRMLDFILKRVPVLEVTSNDPIRRLQRETSTHMAMIEAGIKPANEPLPIGNFLKDFTTHLDIVCVEIRILTEAFYHSAWRIREIARGGMPKLSSFECKGVRTVRNHLIEHPEKQSKSFAQSFLFDGGQGPLLKSQPGSESKEFQDQGLYPNTDEFITAFLGVLGRALAKV